MTSGIYRLTFKSGHYYIGKSIDIQRRWKEHFTKFDKGTAAKSMQACFNSYGYPSCEVLYEVHAEHIDVIEPIVIANNWGPKILNTTKDRCATNIEDKYLELIKLSLGDLCAWIFRMHDQEADLEKRIEDLQQELEDETNNFNEILEDIKDGTALGTAERELKVMTENRDFYKETSETRSKEVLRLKSRGLFARIFNR